MGKIVEVTTPIQEQLLEQNDRLISDMDLRLRQLEDCIDKLMSCVNVSEARIENMQTSLNNWMRHQEQALDGLKNSISSSVDALTEPSRSERAPSELFKELGNSGQTTDEELEKINRFMNSRISYEIPKEQK